MSVPSPRAAAAAAGSTLVKVSQSPKQTPQDTSKGEPAGAQCDALQDESTQTSRPLPPSTDARGGLRFFPEHHATGGPGEHHYKEKAIYDPKTGHLVSFEREEDHKHPTPSGRRTGSGGAGGCDPEAGPGTDGPESNTSKTIKKVLKWILGSTPAVQDAAQTAFVTLAGLVGLLEVDPYVATAVAAASAGVVWWCEHNTITRPAVREEREICEADGGEAPLLAEGGTHPAPPPRHPPSRAMCELQAAIALTASLANGLFVYGFGTQFILEKYLTRTADVTPAPDATPIPPTSVYLIPLGAMIAISVMVGGMYKSKFLGTKAVGWFALHGVKYGDTTIGKMTDLILLERVPYVIDGRDIVRKLSPTLETVLNAAGISGAISLADGGGSAVQKAFTIILGAVGASGEASRHRAYDVPVGEAAHTPPDGRGLARVLTGGARLVEGTVGAVVEHAAGLAPALSIPLPPRLVTSAGQIASRAGVGVAVAELTGPTLAQAWASMSSSTSVNAASMGIAFPVTLGIVGGAAALTTIIQLDDRTVGGRAIGTRARREALYGPAPERVPGSGSIRMYREGAASRAHNFAAHASEAARALPQTIVGSPAPAAAPPAPRPTSAMELRGLLGGSIQSGGPEIPFLSGHDADAAML